MKKLRTPRRTAYEILKKIGEQGSFSNLAIKDELNNNHFQDIDRNLITDMVYGTLENQIRIDWIIQQYVKNNKIANAIRFILRLGIYQILFLDKIPDSAACNEAVKLTKEIGKEKVSGFVNGLLRNVIRNKNVIQYPDKETDPILYLSIMYSYPKWLVSEWINEYGFDFTEEMEAYKKIEYRTSIRPNLLKITKEEWETLLHDRNIDYKRGEWVQNAYYVNHLNKIIKDPIYSHGLCSIQSESSMLVAKILDPKPGQLILDACSAPGGKAAYMAEIALEKASIYACDIYPHRVDLIQKSMNRLDIASVKTYIQDAQIKNPDFINTFNSVLLDVPCSGYGVVNKKPDIKYKKTINEIIELSMVQKNILSVCSQYVKLGGTLVYSTCTIMKKENEEVINHFLQNNTNFIIEDIQKYITTTFLKNRCLNGYIQIIPHLDGIDGFFICKLKRIA